MKIKINSNKVKPLIILAPLDWGFGHTTRCIPIIQELLHNGCRVIVACNSTQTSILKSYFPSLEFAALKGYNISYGKNRAFTVLSIFFQVSKLLTSIKSERRWLARFLQNNPVNGVISDNRYGFYSREIPSIIITHQLQVKTGIGAAINTLVSMRIQRWINRFQACWVPDLKNPDAIAGELSNPVRMPRIPVQYLGCLSRLVPCTRPVEKFELLIILSGPEPQRTILESRLITALKQLDCKAIFIRGLPSKDEIIEDTENIQFFNLVNGKDLNRMVCGAELIICRSGYTSLMDYLKLKKRMIVIPTPGQFEQEYLAAKLHRQQLVLSISQHVFKLESALQQAAAFPYRFPNLETEAYKAHVKSFVDFLKNSQSSVG